MSDILDYCKGREAETFKPGHVLIHEGGQEGKLFVLIEGQVEVLRKDTQVSYIDEPGSIFGEMAVLLDMPSSATVKALSRVKAYVIDDAIAFLGGQPEIALYVATLLARRLYYTTSYLVDLQQQSEGKREDLDLVDKILAQLVEKPDEARDRFTGWTCPPTPGNLSVAAAAGASRSLPRDPLGHQRAVDHRRIGQLVGRSGRCRAAPRSAAAGCRHGRPWNSGSWNSRAGSG